MCRRYYRIVQNLFVICVYTHQVADVKKMMNPELQKHYGLSSHVKQATAISQPLHFCFELDGNGRGCMRTKLTGKQAEWSEPWYSLKCENNGLNAPEHEHKLSLEMINMCVKPREV